MNQPSFNATSGADIDNIGDVASVQLPKGDTPLADGGWSSFRLTPFGVIVMLLLILASAWSAWATREILEMRDRKIVSVSLTMMMREFVAGEARRPQSQASAQGRTIAFLQNVDASIEALVAQGNVVLISEAVAGRSVPDATPAVMALVSARMANSQRTSVPPGTGTEVFDVAPQTGAAGQ